MSSLGNKLTNLRESKNWTKTYVANLIGFNSMQKYANYEYGTREPDNETLKKLANIYDVSTDYLLDNESEKERPIWATENDVLSLDKFLESNGAMTFEGVELSKSQRERVKKILTEVFWEELKKDRDRGVR
ncbi:helix-turn-helix domain-containing protein [Fructilactobacillus cliffordii]|uniref:Helix-turn-helix transcriptional regulator n=1 Tax=Fructilactobacillus cliffordii TaxID=2940299 RepID=A0A9Q8ZV61_9LACO|nr:helix-turn-helix transcriptional regulator [Fructilactobacillus cliffordii]USS89985.1 helix-turn-helix transcriptional regulator [Fructilactobacillus cliffordii]